MAQYRRKPVVVEAFQFKGWTGWFGYAPEWATERDQDRHLGTALFLPDHAALTPRSDVALFITTHGREVRVDINDWVIRGVDGDIYPCKPDIFAETHEAIE
jgi:hypothetical protein